MIRIIDNKRINLTDDEYGLYEKICRSYDRPNMNGGELFKGLFESDENGIIVFLIPPSNRYISMEVYMFFVSVMIHQHIGAASDHVDQLVVKLDNKIKDLDALINRAELLFKKGD